MFLSSAAAGIFAHGDHGGNIVTYDSRSLVINRKHKILFFGSIHYPRSTPQIENEYGNVEAAFHEKRPPYVKWAAKLVVGLQTGVPWVMCKQDDAPDPAINACNGLRCGETFAGPNSPNKPAIWTENWTSVYQAYGKAARTRLTEDFAFHVALFITKGGSCVNYYMVGLLGERIQLHRNRESSKAYRSRNASSNQPLTWYQTTFDAPTGNDPVSLNLGSMGKGEAWVSGQSIGGYWVSFLDSDGKPCQIWYHVPRSFLKPSGNLLVLLEEEKGYPLGISIGTVSVTKVCGHVSSSHLPPVISRQPKNQKDRSLRRKPKIQLGCPLGRKISSILFSSFGTPPGETVKLIIPLEVVIPLILKPSLRRLV